jgi:hypothetical protein
MSYVNPTVPTFTGLKGLELRIQNLQTYLSDNITWIEYFFGLADRLTRQSGEDTVVFPAAWIENKTDPFDCLPSDVYNFCFWTAEDVAEIEYADEFAIRKDNLVTQDVSVIFFVNLKDISSTVSYNVTRSACRNELMNVLNSVKGIDAFFRVEEYIENDIEEIYSGFSFEAIDNNKKELPFWAIRINGKLSYRPDCDA